MNPKFHERFEISIEIEDARKRFVNRIGNRVFDDLFEDTLSVYKYHLRRAVADGLGEPYIKPISFDGYTGRDFYKTLLAIE